MDERDIEKFLAQLTPTQETNVLLKEISAKLTALIELSTPKPEAKSPNKPTTLGSRKLER